MFVIKWSRFRCRADLTVDKTTVATKTWSNTGAVSSVKWCVYMRVRTCGIDSDAVDAPVLSLQLLEEDTHAVAERL